MQLQRFDALMSFNSSSYAEEVIGKAYPELLAAAGPELEAPAILLTIVLLAGIVDDVAAAELGLVTFEMLLMPVLLEGGIDDVVAEEPGLLEAANGEDTDVDDENVEL